MAQPLSRATTTLLVAFLITCSFGGELKDETPCDSQIYCYGELLAKAQDAKIYNDSKTFVDLHMLQSEASILTAFEKLPDKTGDSMKAFVEQYFDGPEIEFQQWNPSDWSENPTFLDNIADADLRTWARELHALWKELGKQIKPDVDTNNDRYSMIYAANPFVVPGGRFREFYYWDSYWIFMGLLLSEMTETVKGMLTNFVDAVENLGHVPNGNRVYYTKRSQPPFLIPSVYLYYQDTADLDTIRTFLPSLEKEYQFWMTNRTVEITKGDNNYTLNRYNVFMGMPRPESYREDIETASGATNDDEKAEVYSNLASAAESGWDFSTRWFGPDKDISSIRTKKVVPVDLNSILCFSEWILSELFTETGDTAKAQVYTDAFNVRKEAVANVFWSESAGVWLDYDLDTAGSVNKFFPSNVMPMWAKCYGGETATQQKVLDYLKDQGVLNYPGGVPTSLDKSGQQWDYPNAWPPLQDIVIDTLRKSDLQEARDYALNLAQNWTTTNWRAYQEMDLMFEKYDVEKQGVPGHGGEYAVQAGFGWSNGVAMKLLDVYGDTLVAEDGSSHVTAYFLLNAICVIISVTIILMK